MKRWMTLLLAVILFLCSFPAHAETKFSRNIFGFFDTVTILMGYTDSEESFDHVCRKVTDKLQSLHRLFDGYNSYPNLHNLWYLNRHAAKEPVVVDDVFFDLLAKCQQMQSTPGYEKVNIAMGSVLTLWHEARENGVLPEKEALSAAGEHMDFSKLVLDSENKTVFFSDPKLKLDLGAVAKGYAADQVKEILYQEMPAFLISLGGNVYCGNAPMDGRKRWGVSVQCPDQITPIQPGSDMLDVLYATNLSLVTSGDYQRFMELDGVRYHHIIDPDTLMPASHLRAVTVVCESGLKADYLSTLLFLLPFEEGKALVESLPDTEALFVLSDGSLYLTDGLKLMAQSHGASAR